MKPIFLLFVMMAIPSPAVASILSVSSPDVEEGERSVGTGMSWEMDDNPDRDDLREYAVEMGYSPTDYWNTALEFSVDDENGDAKYAVTAWKNTLQFIKQTERIPVSVGLRLQYEKAHIDGEADEITARLLLRHQNEIIDTRFNIGVEREIESDSKNEFAGDIRASIRYKWSDNFKTAIDYLGDTGSLHHLQSFENQDHRAGPVIYGSLHDISYEAGYLAGLSNNSPDRTFKIALGLKF